MLTLGIETSQIPGSIALLEGNRLVEERSLQPEQRHARTLVPEIQRLLSGHGFAPQDCGLIAVSEGPGSFTGLRIGVTCAKTLAYATGAKLASVPTLQAVAEGAGDDLNRIFVLSDAQRQQLFVSEFVHSHDMGWEPVGEVVIVDAQAWAEQRHPSDVVCGPALTKFAELFSGKCQILPETVWAPRASLVAHLGLMRMQSNRLSDVWSLQPFYLRKSAAEERLETSN